MLAPVLTPYSATDSQTTQAGTITAIDLVRRELMQLSAGTIVDTRYQIEAALGEGGFATVYRAKDLTLGRSVALKFLGQEHSSEQDLKRFHREGKLLSRISHKNIVGFYSFGVWQKQRYIAGELCEGESLRAFLSREDSVRDHRFLRITDQVLDALEYIHEQGIIHRDLKPENILICDQPEPMTVKLLDFGLAKLVGDIEGRLTQTGALLGSPAYMPPELWSGVQQDPRSDIYSAACIFYEMLAGVPIFTADSTVGLAYLQAHERPRDLSDPDLNTVLMKALQKDPQLRYASAAQLKSALNEMKAKFNEPLQLFVAHKKLSRPSKKGMWAAAALIAVAAIGTMTGLIICKRSSSGTGVELGRPAAELRNDAQTLWSLGRWQEGLKKTRELARSGQATAADLTLQSDFEWLLNKKTDSMTSLLEADKALNNQKSRHTLSKSFVQQAESEILSRLLRRGKRKSESVVTRSVALIDFSLAQDQNNLTYNTILMNLYPAVITADGPNERLQKIIARFRAVSRLSRARIALFPHLNTDVPYLIELKEEEKAVQPLLATCAEMANLGVNPADGSRFVAHMFDYCKEHQDLRKTICHVGLMQTNHLSLEDRSELMLKLYSLYRLDNERAAAHMLARVLQYYVRFNDKRIPEIPGKLMILLQKQPQVYSLDGIIGLVGKSPANIEADRETDTYLRAAEADRYLALGDAKMAAGLTRHCLQEFPRMNSRSRLRPYIITQLIRNLTLLKDWQSLDDFATAYLDQVDDPQMLCPALLQQAQAKRRLGRQEQQKILTEKALKIMAGQNTAQRDHETHAFAKQTAAQAEPAKLP